MSKNEKNAFFSKPFNGPILIFWNLILYTFLCTKIKKFTIVNFFSLDACSRPMCAPALSRMLFLHSRLHTQFVFQPIGTLGKQFCNPQSLFHSLLHSLESSNCSYPFHSFCFSAICCNLSSIENYCFFELWRNWI